MTAPARSRPDGGGAVWCLLVPGIVEGGGLDFRQPITSSAASTVPRDRPCAHFGVTADGGLTTVRREYRLLDGTYDIDEATVRPVSRAICRPREIAPFVLSCRRYPTSREAAPIATGTGSHRLHQRVPQVSSAKFTFPPIPSPASRAAPLAPFWRPGWQGS